MYAVEKLTLLEAQGKLTRGSRFRKRPRTLEELNEFFTIIINKGVIKEIKDYWKTSWESQIPFFWHVMSWDRFELIFWMVHVSHTEGSTADPT